MVEQSLLDNEGMTPSVALRIGNVVSFVLWFASNAILGKPLVKITRANPTHMTPAHWAFSIWMFIYIGVTGFTVYQAILPTERSAAIVNSIGPLFMVANFCNAMWCVVFTRDTKFWISFSCFFLLGLVAALAAILSQAKSWRPNNHHGIYEIILVDVLFSVYASWSTVASIINFAVAGVVLKWDGGPLSPSAWAAVMISIAASINIAVLFRCGNAVFPITFVWAIFGIYTKNKSDKLVANVSLAAAIIVAVLIYYDLFFN